MSDQPTPTSSGDVPPFDPDTETPAAAEDTQNPTAVARALAAPDDADTGPVDTLGEAA